MNKIIFVILFLLLGSKLLIADDKSPPKVTTQQYDNWTYQCVESGKDKNCEVSQTIRIQNTNINFSVTYTKFIKEAKYVSKATFLIPSDSQNSSRALSGLASQFGVSMQSAALEDLSSPSIIPDLLHSRTFVSKIINNLSPEN